MKFISLFFGIVLCLVCHHIFAQRYTPTIESISNINPSFSGIYKKNRAGIQYRNQWPQLPGNFTTSTFTLAIPFEDTRNNIGVEVTHQKVNAFIYDHIKANFAHEIHLSSLSIRMGLSGGVHFIQNSTTDFIFGDQLDNNGHISGTEEIDFLIENGNYYTIDAGFLIGTPAYWLGFSAHNINQPSITIAQIPEKKDIRYFLHGGLKLVIPTYGKKDLNLFPSFFYDKNGELQQLTGAVYAYLFPLSAGIGYKSTFSNSGSLLFQAGIQTGSIHFTYNYDLGLETAVQHGGAHQVSLFYLFGTKKENPISRSLSYPFVLN